MYNYLNFVNTNIENKADNTISEVCDLIKVPLPRENG